MKMQRMYLLPEGREKNTLAPRTVKMMLSQIRSRVLRKSPPLFREKRQVFFIASTRIRKNIGFSQMNIKASHNDEKALTKHNACLGATANKIHKRTHRPTEFPHRSITLPLSKKTCGNGSVRSTNRHRKKTPKAFKEFLRAIQTNSAQTFHIFGSLSGIYYRIL